jgi:protein required for attachment to host cells
MNRTAIVVVDAKLARIYGIESVDSPRVKVKLVERKTLTNPDADAAEKMTGGRPATESNSNRQAGPVHPIGAQRERHRLEHNRHFGHEIAREAATVVAKWKEGTIVLVAEPHMLGLLREPLRAALHHGIELKELAKDYAQLGVADLCDHLLQNRLIPQGNRGTGG